MTDKHNDTDTTSVRQPYTVPTVTTLQFRSERGYAMSGDGVLGRIESEQADLVNLVFDDSRRGGAVSTYELHNDWENDWGNEGWF